MRNVKRARAIFALFFALLLALLLPRICAAQVGGAMGLAPDPDQLAANQDTNPNWATGNWTGYGYTNACAKIVSLTNVGGYTGNAVNLAGCGGGSRVFDLNLSLHNHEAILYRWKAYASPGSLISNVNVQIYDNCHGDGTASVQQGRFQNTLNAPSSVFTTMFQEEYTNIAEHGSDSACYDSRFTLGSVPGWPGASKSESLGFRIVDSNANVEQVTTAGTTGSSTPAWCTTTNCTTTDGTITWTNEGPNPPFYITSVEAEEEWFPLRTFLLYPNYRGYLWSDLVPPERYTQIQPISAGSLFYNFLGAGSEPVAGEIMGVSMIDPPAADSLSQLTLTVKLATAAGCGSGVLATDTFAAPASVQAWQFTPTQYGSLTVGNAYYVCSSLYLTSGMTLIDSYPDWKIYYENATFRNALFNWYDPNSTWEHNGAPLILIGTYARWSASFGADTTAGQLSDTAYIQGVNSLGPVNDAPTAVKAPIRTNGSFITDYCSQGFTGTLSSFGTFSAIDPLSGNDQLTPYLKVYSEFCPNITHWNILNNVMGCLVTEQQDSTSSPYCTVAPTYAPSVTPSTGGTISANYLFLEAVGWSTTYTSGNSPPAAPLHTLPSAPLTVNLSTAGCAGVNCSVGVGGLLSTSFCLSASGRWIGYTIYAATGSTSTPPANSAFQEQYLSSPGMLGSGGYIPCGTGFTLSAINSGPPPPTTDVTYHSRPFWVASTTTDETTWNDFFTGMNDSTYKTSVGGMYMADEPSYYSRRWLNELDGTLYGNNLNLPVSCVLIGPGAIQTFRDECDLIGEDPYGIGFGAANANEYATGELGTQNCAVYVGGNATTTINNCFPSRVDVDVDDVARATFGARPAWNVVQQFDEAIPYAVMKQQIWKAIIDCQVYGSLGCDVMTWGWVDSTGLEAQIFANQSGQPIRNNTNAWFDSKRATNELKALVPVLLTPVEDSPLLGLGTVVSAVSSSATVHTECTLYKTSVYESASMWPDAPAWFVTHTDAATGDQYIFANNLCSAGAAFNETFTLANPPAGATQVEALYEGRSLPITSNQFTDSWQDEDVHIYVIRAPRGMYVH